MQEPPMFADLYARAFLTATRHEDHVRLRHLPAPDPLRVPLRVPLPRKRASFMAFITTIWPRPVAPQLLKPGRNTNADCTT